MVLLKNYKLAASDSTYFILIVDTAATRGEIQELGDFVCRILALKY